ncbi:hypothetical protein [Telluribacter sp. SYSU D00476]|uniref:hypothetical protein n=1 Tax=Telluribacter sp. SYSU D00476 TaxID=2811430 RepID=UPI001FF22F6E|nr:hypothetical protein [Telluribacter sp. SYSU D00476]
MNRGLLPKSRVKDNVFFVLAFSGWIGIASLLFSDEEVLKINNRFLNKGVVGNTAILEGSIDTDDDVMLFLGDSQPIPIRNGRFICKVALPDSVNVFDIRAVHSSGILVDSKSITVVRKPDTSIMPVMEIGLLNDFESREALSE